MVKPEPTSTGRTRRKPSQDDSDDEDADDAISTPKRVKLERHANGASTNREKRAHVADNEEEEEDGDGDGDGDNYQDAEDGIAASAAALAQSGEKQQLIRDDTG